VEGARHNIQTSKPEAVIRAVAGRRGRTEEFLGRRAL